MATISSAIEVQDRFSSVLNNLYAGLDRAVNKFETLQNVMSRSADFDVGSNLKNDLNSANQAVSNINNNINNTQNNLMQVNTTVNRISTNIINITNNQKKFNDEVKEGVNSTDSLIGKVKSLVGAYLGFQGVKALINTSDQFIQTTARLNMMNDGLQTTAELQDMIFQSAQRSRASYADTANAVAQLGNRARNAFNSNEEVVAFSEQLNKMFTIAGASQQEMSSATLQLTQALGSGVLRGEEFNAVFEAAPNVMQAVADYIGKPIGELKDLASEGEITADIVKKAMFAAADETNAKFESMPMTWAHNVVNLSNL
ncbi:tape measure protein [Clostridium neonatale]|uniref:tape measure protein n=1 Tax=Clostridium neonatale TaxID=137838 RepID=UPI0029370CF4|nr:tape measure protein [Clostridium neonatale]